MTKTTFTIHVYKDDCSVVDYQCNDDNQCTAGGNSLTLKKDGDKYQFVFGDKTYTFTPPPGTVDISLNEKWFQAPKYFQTSGYQKEAESQQCSLSGQFITYLANAYSKPEAFITTAVGKTRALDDKTSEIDALKILTFKYLKKILDTKGTQPQSSATTYDSLAVAFALDPKTATPQQIEEKIKALAVAKPVELSTIDKSVFIGFLTNAYKKPEAIIATAVGKIRALDDKTSEIDALKILTFKYLKKLLDTKGTQPQSSATTYDSLAVAFKLDPKTATPQQIEEKIKALAVAKPVELSTNDKSVFIGFLTDAYKKPEAFITTAVGKIRALDDKTSEIDALKILTFKYLKKLLDAKIEAGATFTATPTTYDELATALGLKKETAKPQDIQAEIEKLAMKKEDAASINKDIIAFRDANKLAGKAAFLEHLKKQPNIKDYYESLSSQITSLKARITELKKTDAPGATKLETLIGKIETTYQQVKSTVTLLNDAKLASDKYNIDLALATQAIREWDEGKTPHTGQNLDAIEAISSPLKATLEDWKTKAEAAKIYDAAAKAYYKKQLQEIKALGAFVAAARKTLTPTTGPALPTTATDILATRYPKNADMQLTLNSGDDKQIHYMVEGLSQTDGEKQLAALTLIAKKEEAWLYIEGTENGVTFKRWYEVGVNETANGASVMFAEVPLALQKNPAVKISRVVNYHIHPKTDGQYRSTEVPSYDQDLPFGFLKVVGFISKTFTTPLDYETRIVTPEGTYFIKPLDQKKCAALDDKTILKWLTDFDKATAINTLSPGIQVYGHGGLAEKLKIKGVIDAGFITHPGIKPKYLHDFIAKQGTTLTPADIETLYQMDRSGMDMHDIRAAVEGLVEFTEVIAPFETSLRNLKKNAFGGETKDVAACRAFITTTAVEADLVKIETELKLLKKPPEKSALHAGLGSAAIQKFEALKKEYDFMTKEVSGLIATRRVALKKPEPVKPEPVLPPATADVKFVAGADTGLTIRTSVKRSAHALMIQMREDNTKPNFSYSISLGSLPLADSQLTTGSVSLGLEQQKQLAVWIEEAKGLLFDRTIPNGKISIQVRVTALKESKAEKPADAAKSIAEKVSQYLWKAIGQKVQDTILFGAQSKEHSDYVKTSFLSVYIIIDTGEAKFAGYSKLKEGVSDLEKKYSLTDAATFETYLKSQKDVKGGLDKQYKKIGTEIEAFAKQITAITTKHPLQAAELQKILQPLQEVYGKGTGIIEAIKADAQRDADRAAGDARDAAQKAERLRTAHSQALSQFQAFLAEVRVKKAAYEKAIVEWNKLPETIEPDKFDQELAKRETVLDAFKEALDKLEPAKEALISAETEAQDVGVKVRKLDLKSYAITLKGFEDYYTKKLEQLQEAKTGAIPTLKYDPSYPATFAAAAASINAEMLLAPGVIKLTIASTPCNAVMFKPSADRAKMIAAMTKLYGASRNELIKANPGNKEILSDYQTILWTMRRETQVSEQEQAAFAPIFANDGIKFSNELLFTSSETNPIILPKLDNKDVTAQYLGSHVFIFAPASDEIPNGIVGQFFNYFGLSRIVGKFNYDK